MDCPLIQADLIAYHFGVLPDGERRRVEEHLVACSACLRTYLSLKAHVDRGARGDEQPSERARLALRAAVEQRFRPTRGRRLRRMLTRPVPLYQGLAAIAVVAVSLALAPALARALRHDAGARPAERVDTNRPAAESLSIY
jgi:anti-sigma factor RsiW